MIRTLLLVEGLVGSIAAAITRRLALDGAVNEAAEVRSALGEAVERRSQARREAERIRAAGLALARASYRHKAASLRAIAAEIALYESRMLARQRAVFAGDEEGQDPGRSFDHVAPLEKAVLGWRAHTLALQQYDAKLWLDTDRTVETNSEHVKTIHSLAELMLLGKPQIGKAYFIARATAPASGGTFFKSRMNQKMRLTTLAEQSLRRGAGLRKSKNRSPLADMIVNLHRKAEALTGIPADIRAHLDWLAQGAFPQTMSHEGRPATLESSVNRKAEKETHPLHDGAIQCDFLHGRVPAGGKKILDCLDAPGSKKPFPSIDIRSNSPRTLHEVHRHPEDLAARIKAEGDLASTVLGWPIGGPGLDEVRELYRAPVNKKTQSIIFSDIECSAPSMVGVGAYAERNIGLSIKTNGSAFHAHQGSVADTIGQSAAVIIAGSRIGEAWCYLEHDAAFVGAPVLWGSNWPAREDLSNLLWISFWGGLMAPTNSPDVGAFAQRNAHWDADRPSTQQGKSVWSFGRRGALSANAAFAWPALVFTRATSQFGAFLGVGGFVGDYAASGLSGRLINNGEREEESAGAKARFKFEHLMSYRRVITSSLGGGDYKGATAWPGDTLLGDRGGAEWDVIWDTPEIADLNVGASRHALSDRPSSSGVAADLIDAEEAEEILLWSGLGVDHAGVYRRGAEAAGFGNRVASGGAAAPHDGPPIGARGSETEGKPAGK